MTNASILTDQQLAAELARVEDRCAELVCSIHGVISAALAERLYALRDETERRMVAA